VEAARIIRREHRSFANLLHGMLYLVHTIRDQGAKPNFDILGAMIYYIDAFPERFHHPKEDDYLFMRVRIRWPDAAPLIDRLKTEHRTGAEKIRTLEQALMRYQHGGPPEFYKFMTAVEAYADFQWEHMRVEEVLLLPLAEKHLTASDWETVDGAFLGHTDPLLGVEAGAHYANVLRRITNLARVGPLR
jgi:hemerythrin-like domain-containing protein